MKPTFSFSFPPASGVSKHVTIYSSIINRILSNERLLSNVSVFMSKHQPPSYQGDWPELTKFDKLRVKTEMQLVQLINNELELGIRDARQALKSADTWVVVEECSRRANRAYSKIARLIPLVVDITDDERSKVESRLKRLQGMLEALSAIGSTPTPAEYEIAALARAVWEARGCAEGLPEEDWFRAERALKAQSETNAACFAR
ncbi:MAG: DUF2934 domain-containing protein [Acidobacteriota bacterium]|nr:DUF2934 domain-containing protein [Acidobacteriota bacterium]